MTTVLLVGPDGTGKTLLARQLADQDPAARRQHYRPRPTGRAPTADPHAEPPRSVPASVLKLLLLWTEQWRSVPLRRRSRGGLVVVERGFWDQAVDPRRYRLPAEVAWVVRSLGRLLPRPHLVVLLAGPGELVHRRKPELDPAEIERQIAVWRGLLPAIGRHAVELDVSEPPAVLLGRVLERLRAT